MKIFIDPEMIGNVLNPTAEGKLFRVQVQRYVPESAYVFVHAENALKAEEVAVDLAGRCGENIPAREWNYETETGNDYEIETTSDTHEVVSTPEEAKTRDVNEQFFFESKPFKPKNR